MARVMEWRISGEDEKEGVTVVGRMILGFAGDSGRVEGVFEERRRGGEGVGGIESESDISSTGAGVLERRGLVRGGAFLDDVVGRCLGDGVSVDALRGRPRGFLAGGLQAAATSVVTGMVALGGLPFFWGELLCLSASRVIASAVGGCGTFMLGGNG